MSKPKYGVKYVCDDFPNVIFGWSETLKSKKGLYFFIKYTPDMKKYIGSVWITQTFFDESFREVP